VIAGFFRGVTGFFRGVTGFFRGVTGFFRGVRFLRRSARFLHLHCCTAANAAPQRERRSRSRTAAMQVQHDIR
jgi:hypothetical protein